VYDKQLAKIDRLKQMRASWRRDRMIRDQMSASHATAETLAKVDARLRQLNRALRASRAALVRAIDKELAGPGPAAQRKASLLGWRRSAQKSLRRGAKKIVIPDDHIDPLADPEELDYQAALLGQSEEQLNRELDRLSRQARRYRRMVTLQKTRKREADLGGFDNDQPRRTLSYAGNARADAQEGDIADPSSAPPPQSEDGPWPSSGVPDSGNPMFDVVLADVVDASTVRALKQAELSRDPGRKAQAAERARAQVKARLERIQKRRRLIESRAKTLRSR
jgi:hypothetical protein